MHNRLNEILGNFYSNITLSTDQRDKVVQFLNKKKTTAYVHAEEGFVCVFPKSDEVLFPLAEKLSSQFKCLSLAVMNHDDSMLLYQLFRDGEFVDDYNSFPGHFSGVEEPPSGGDAKALCRAYGQDFASSAVEEVLRKCYTFELNRHDAIVAKLELPYCTVGGGFTYIEEGDPPDDLDIDALVLSFPDGDDDESEFWPKSRPFAPSAAVNVPKVDSDNVINFMERAMKKVQESANEYVKEMMAAEFEGSAGDGAVKVKSIGKMQIESIKIDSSVVDVTDLEQLESLIVTALNDVSQKTREKMESMKQKILAAQIDRSNL